MKNIIVLAVFSAVVVACAKKETNNLQDSNTMLEEPQVVVADSATAAKPADQTAVVPTNDTGSVKTDSAVVK